MNDPRRWSDEDLADFLAKQEPTAAEALVERYLPGLFDFTARVTLDLDKAAEVTETTLKRAWEEGGERPAALSLRSWLFGLARSEALDERHQPDEQGAARGLSVQDECFSLVEGDGDEELAQWVWQIARAQRPPDFATLDLSLRRRLPAIELAQVSSISRRNIDGVVAKLRTTLEEGFTATALFHRGGAACSDLDQMAAKSKGGLAPALERSIRRHAMKCEDCQATLAALPRATAVYALLRDIEPPLRVWASALVAVGAGVGTGVASDEAGPAPLQMSNEEEPPDAMAADEVMANVEDETEDAEGEAEREIIDAEEPADDDAWIWPDRPVVDEERPEQAEEEGRPAEKGPVSAAAPVGAAGAPANSADRQERIRFEGGAFGLPPPRGPRGRFSRLFSDDDGRRRIVPTAVLAVLTLIFAYLGFVVGSSIEGGGSAGAVAPLPTRAPGLREIACGTGPINVDQGSSAVLTFDSQSLSGYQISNIGVRGVSSNAIPQSIDARQQQGLSIRFEAAPIPGSAGRTDEYSLVVTFSKGEERTVSECTVRVKAPGTAAAPTSTPVAQTSPVATTPTVPPQPTSTPRPPTATLAPPTATLAPATATSVPPTNTPPTLCTATPLPTPTGTPLPNPFPTFTPVVGPCP